MEQVMEGKISKEEADKQLKALGVELPKHHDMGDIFANLDEQTKAKAIKIIQNVKSGKITREEAQKQLKALGVEMPMHHGKEKFEKLDEETKTAGGTGRSMEAVHEESRYSLYRCHLLRKCHALSD